MLIDKTPCLYQGPGKQNPVSIGGYDILRTTDDPLNPDYWITSQTTAVYDAAYDNGSGGILHFNDRLRISKGATDGCTSTVTLDIEANPLVFSYYPPHSLDVVFVLDVTASMMSSMSRKMAQAKRALIQTIQLLWQQNRDTKVTIIPFARDAYIPESTGGFSYDYLGTLFTWRRSTTSGNLIGQILGYRNGSYVSATDIPSYMAQSAPIAASAERSLYNYYNYYKIQFSDIYNEDGSPKPDTVLENYLSTVYSQDPAAYTGNFITAVAAGTPLTGAQLPYSMNDTGYENNTILDNMIWAIPYGEDTNTEAGLNQAYTFFKTPGFAQSDDILRRAVILITDGQANRSVNPQYPDVYARPGSTDSDFFPDVPGGPWKYFLYLLQTQPSLIAETASRSATSEELILALQRAYETAQKIKEPADGNASLFVLGIEIDAQTPGPYTRDDILNIMRTIATTGTYLHEATENDPEHPIIEELERLVRNLLILTGGLKITITDSINTALFDYVAGSLRITGIQDSLKLKSINAPDITDPSDPDFTVYKKPALLPDLNDTAVQNGVITADLGILPYLPASPDSQLRIQLKYQITNKGSAHGTHLHTNYDKETLAAFLEPNHLDAGTSKLTYDNPIRTLRFPTPVISCNSDYTIEKFVGSSKENAVYKSIDITACQTVCCRFVVTNHTNAPVQFPLLYDVRGAESISEALSSQNVQVLAENFTLPALGTAEFTLDYKTKCGDGTVRDYAILKLEEGYLYDNAEVMVHDGTAYYTVQYLNKCTGQRICPDKLITDVNACSVISACRHICSIPCWKFVCAQPYHLNLCEGENVLKLFYTRC
ncbi:hypothetical protein [Anaerostipes sp.]|uniref:hypothetical protein n=1 Tax=Anaerostipes sp. TaxID=1872530 RepID=UPI0025BBFCF5|nr:hypothetical protein [Anaerostipes sp.]MBS7008671.1 hypothetical protein [Anaerostipes sp.]